MGQTHQKVPRVFISSTSDDLRVYRDAAKEAAIQADMLPVMMEYFTASGDRPPLQKCLDEVDRTDVLVVLCAHRYGWVPPDKSNREKKSITWLECEQAVAKGCEVVAFLVDEKQSWLEEYREAYRLTKAMNDGTATPALFAEVNECTAQLKKLKDWFNGRAIRKTFTTPEDLRGSVSNALHDWRRRKWKDEAGETETVLPANPERYLRLLMAESSHIDIRGLQVGTERVHRFPIEDLFISLTTSIPSEEAGRGKGKKSAEKAGRELQVVDSHVPLHKLLRQDRLAILGDPGSGKTTFLRRVAHTLCQTRLGEVPDAAAARLEIPDRTFPIYLRLSELAAHIEKCRRKADAPTKVDSPAWIPYLLGNLGRESAWGLDAEFFRKQMENGACTIMLDGLDEAPDRVFRETLIRLIENATQAFHGCRIVVTSRPAGYRDSTVLSEFSQATIDPLSDEATQTFLSRWCQALYGEGQQAADQHCDELMAALKARTDIRRMARNPVMLTALAVVHWNERRLPEQRADLYESIIRWLSRSRERRPERASADRTVRRLQELALAMQSHSTGMQTQVSKRWAAEVLAEHCREEGDDDEAAIRRADEFLDAEELDSGIIVARGHTVQFWHRTFQEFLAARAIAARTEARQREVLWTEQNRVYLSEWREVMLLLSGVLYQQGKEKVDGLVEAFLNNLGSDPTLADQARCAGLLGAIIRDLSPFLYEPPNSKYDQLLHHVGRIFDKQRTMEMDISQRIAAADALGQAGDERIDPQSKEYWVPVPAGKFWMGAQKSDKRKRNYDEEAEDLQSSWPEEPVHEVELDGYSIARYPVTVGQFQQFVDIDGYQEERWWSAGGFGEFESPGRWDDQQPFPARPVTDVSWYEAAAFCAWMASWRPGVRLPTEAEWERAARGTDARIFSWGDEPADEQRLNYKQNVGHVTPVGIFPRGNTPDGIADLAGNVWEWCADWYGKDYYAHSPSKNPRGPEAGDGRVLRGGSWVDRASYCRAASRNDVHPDTRDYYNGFRLLFCLQNSP